MVILETSPTQLTLQHRPYSVWIITSCLAIGVPFSVILLGLALTWILYFWWLPLFLFVAILLGSGALIAFGGTATYFFDKSLNKFTVKRRGLFHKDVIEYRLTDIEDVYVVQPNWSVKKTENGDFQIIIAFRYEKPVPLNGTSSNGEEKMELANMIRAFLGMRRQTVGCVPR
jgi:hypothetical protein